MNRKEEIEKGCGNSFIAEEDKHLVDDDETYTICGRTTIHEMNGTIHKALCPTCQARLDELIRAEQDFLRLIDEWAKKKGYFCDYKDIEELKSTIKQEKKE
jgi:hypothetical protein